MAGSTWRRRWSRAGHRVSLGHSAATYEQALAGIAAGARHATHLFNRMSPLTHRAPGLTGAVLAEDAVAAEIICDGYHVHPAVATAAIRAKRVERTMAITDGSAGAGLPVGSKVSLGGRAVTVTEDACFLDDGTLCGSRITMDAAFRRLLRQGFTPVEASRMCSGTQAAELGLAGQGVIAPGRAGRSGRARSSSSTWSRLTSAAFPPGRGRVQRHEPREPPSCGRRLDQ